MLNLLELVVIRAYLLKLKAEKESDKRLMTSEDVEKIYGQMPEIELKHIELKITEIQQKTILHKEQSLIADKKEIEDLKK